MLPVILPIDPIDKTKHYNPCIDLRVSFHTPPFWIGPQNKNLAKDTVNRRTMKD